LQINPPIITIFRKALGGSQGAQHVADQNEEDWVIKPLSRQLGGVKGTVNEYIAAYLARKMGLPVPEHLPVYIPDIVIGTYWQLSAFEPGFVLGCRFEEGFDLSLARRNAVISYLKDNLAHLDNKVNAIGIMVGDTWMANADRGAGSLASQLRQAGFATNNEGNLYFSRLEGANNLWVIRAIDFGHAFFGAKWGSSVIDAWPKGLFGAMRFFFEMGWLTHDYEMHRNDIDGWVKTVGNVDITAEVQNAVSSMPVEWLRGAGITPHGPMNIQDLVERLIGHRSDLGAIIQAEYASVAKRY
jgi:hypothetical protein